MLQVTNLTIRFGGFNAVDGLNLQVEPGKLTALIGPNGAGKTTFFNAVSGLIKPATGTVLLNGKDLTGARPYEITKAGMLRSFQIARGFPRLTVFEHLMLYDQDNPGEMLSAAVLGGWRQRENETAERALAVARRLKIDHVLDNLVTQISGGQKKLLEIGRGLMAEPQLLLLDEPVAGVNPTLAEQIGDQLRELVTDGLTILLIEHDMALVGRIADHVIVMAQGKRLAEGTFESVRNDPAVQDAYLGGGIVDAVGS